MILHAARTHEHYMGHIFNYFTRKLKEETRQNRPRQKKSLHATRTIDEKI